MSYNLTTIHNSTRSGLIGTLLSVFFCAAIIFNILSLYVFFRVKRPIRRPPNYFLAAILFVDLISAIIWVIPAITAAVTWKWILTYHLCNFHGFILIWGFCSNMHLFVAIVLEKFVKILFPSKHKDAFYNKTVILIVIAALSIFDTVISLLPIIGWAKISFFVYQFQCAPDYLKHVSNLNFTFVLTYAIPVILIITMTIGIIWKIKSLRQKVGPSTNAKLVLEERKEIPKESFAEKLKKQQESFQRAGMKKKKPKVGSKKNKDKKKQTDNKSDDDYVTESDSNESSHFEESTDDEDTYIRDYDDYKRMKKYQADAKKKKRVYTFRHSDLMLAITALLCFTIYSLLWLPYWVIAFVWIHNPLALSVELYIFFTLITFIGIFFKPLVFMTNKQLRHAFLQAFFCKRKKASNNYNTKSEKPQAPESNIGTNEENNA